MKTTNPNDGIQRRLMLNELNHHGRQSIAPRPSIRKMYDTTNTPNSWTVENPFCLALEWMETTLADVPCILPLRSPILVRNVVKAVLQALAAVEREGLVYSGTPCTSESSAQTLSKIDLKPSNVLLSGIDGPSPKAKLGDLGLSMKAYIKRVGHADFT